MDRPIPIIYNNNLVYPEDGYGRLADIDDYSSFIWTTRYNTSGDFQLIVDARPEYRDIFLPDNFVNREDVPESGIIESIQLKRNEDGRNQYIIKGRFVDSVLARRIIVPSTPTATAQTVDAFIHTLISNNAIVYESDARHIPGITWGGYTGSTLEEITGQYTGKNLLTTIQDLCKTYNIGYRMNYNSGLLMFNLFQGKDRTYDQSTNDRVIFSDKFENLLSSQYQEDYQKKVTSVLVTGKEGFDGIRAWAGGNVPGFSRYEIYKEERSAVQDELTDSEFYTQLENIGSDYITNYTSSFSGSVLFDSYKFREDVDVGDICVIECSDSGLSFEAGLMEVIESVDESGKYSAQPSFGIII